MDQQLVTDLAVAYCQEIQQAYENSIAAEPEAQLTVPLATFFRAFTQEAGLGDLGLIREAQLTGVRPDFAATVDGKPCGWIELKAPGHTLVGERWRGREKSQWELLAQLDSLVVTDGRKAVLYFAGAVAAECTLPFDEPNGWDSSGLLGLLERFVSAKITPIKRVSQLADRLAPLARFIRIRLDEGLEQKVSPVLEAKTAWDGTVHQTASSEQFSSDVAQVIAYAMAIAGLSGQADRNGDGMVTLEEAKDALATAHRNVLAAALGPIIGIPKLTEYIGPELGAIMRLISSIDVSAVQASKDSRGEPWLWFYEDFLARYDPDARKRSGVYYTPMSIVQFQVRVVDDLLRNRFRQTLGFGSESVVTLDPATGSGTYPLAVIDQAVETAFQERGPGGSKQVARNLTKNVLAFEILPGPYSVAHLRIGQRLAEAQGQAFQVEEIGVYLTDTLEDPQVAVQPGLFGDAKVLAEAAEKARQVKAHRQITVAIGNPPYDRATSASGGWVVHREDGQPPLFDDVIKPAQDTGVIFSAQASLYNMYVYFWRWAIWKVFQQDPREQAVISFITASSWLEGPAFVGLRKLAAETASEIWVLDLGGEGRGARKEENVFDIQSPVAIVTLVKSGKATRTAKIFYRRVRGSAQEKFDHLDTMSRLNPEEGWEEFLAPNGERFIPQNTDETWSSLPLLADLFPWQQPGIMYSRAWPVAPSRDVLRRRWEALLSATDAQARSEKFVTSDSGRNIHTQVGSLPKLASLAPDEPSQPIVRMGWRSFDPQWTFDDPRLAKTDSPALWQSLSDKQIFLVSPWTARLSNGPAATVSVGVPDKHYFCNRGGKDVIPLYRDSECMQPNITAGLLEQLSVELSISVTAEDLMAYCFALVAHQGYTTTFQQQLGDSPARIPLTKDSELFRQAVELGRELLWLQTYGLRFASEERPQARVPRSSGIVWLEAVASIPEDSGSIRYDEKTHQLHIGEGVVGGIAPDVRRFEVSGMNVLDKWLGARTRKGIGRASGRNAKPLDRIRPTEWEDEWNDELLNLLRVLTETVNKSPVQRNLLDQVIKSPLFAATDLPEPTLVERKVPKTIVKAPVLREVPEQF